MDATQYRRATVGAALGVGARARGLPGDKLRRDCPRGLGVGPSYRTRGVETALLIAGVLMLASPLIGLWLRMPRIGARGEETVILDDPEVRLELTGRSGPVVVEIEYRVEGGNALAFHSLMHEVQMFRQRNGAYDWSIARDVADPELWTERYRCPTWFDYLRQRNRATRSETETEQRAIAFHIGPGPVRVRRMLERPLGSVRSKDRTTNTAPQAETTATTTARTPRSEPLQQLRRSG